MANSYIPQIQLICLTVTVCGFFFLAWTRHGQRSIEKSRLKVARLKREENTGVPPSPSDYHYSITFDSVRIAITDLRSKKTKTIALEWAEVSQAIAFKRDFFSVDCLCLSFRRTDGTGIEVNEEMAGWNRLVGLLPEVLPGCEPHLKWFSAIVFPAFAANPTEIYSRTAAVENA
jgi:hypothetical protein